ncbi:formate dehydrogenase subunit alpha [Alloacidobacterium dinghuense]|uniref:nitrate reductase (cytochrome) n=2 Tax=Alloacidobacterium dinghuense TaxID=2763107 RepID=A0A7G8BQK1_9BACT|nr:formate dehydrogenase subunit alpha [Alloacidobacterium dinghuense]QNI34821.1 formate dehydrogenase subunit alpha [Alloacidobacterium dinghuense]
MVSISIDGHTASVSDGELLVEAILREKEIPHICYHSPLMGPIQTCDTCLVEVDGKITRACGIKVSSGMEVVTDSKRARDARAEAFDVILGNHMLYCTVCDNNNENCRVHNTALALNVQHQSHPFKPKPYEVDMSNPFYRYDPSQCILCGQCVQACQTVEVNETLSIGWELEHPRVLWDGGMQIAGSSCVSCGHCVTVCPCNALMEKSMLGEAGYLSGMPKDALNKMIEVVKAVEPEMGYGMIMQVSQTEAKMREERIERTKTVCTYCGVGCSYDVWTKERKILKIVPLHGDANQISTCVKGKFGWDYVNHPDRLQKPLIREGSNFREADWKEALNLVTTKLSSIKQQYGPDSIGVIVSSKTTNEDGYLMQKFARAVIGTNNVDNCSRYCQSPATMGLFRTVGYGGDSGSIKDIGSSALVVIVGANTAESHPVLATRVKRAHKLHGQRLIVADPRTNEMAERADIHFRPRPGTDLVWISAMSRYMFDNGHAKIDFIEEWVNGLDEFRKSLEPFTIDYASRICEVPLETLQRVAQEIATAESMCILWAMGITQHTTASDESTAVSNLLLVTGNYMRPGCGAYPLRGHNNVQGASDIGAMPDNYPGYQHVNDPGIRERFEKSWGVKLPSLRGLDNHQMVDAVYDGKLRAIYLAGEDMISADSNANVVAGAFEKLDFFVVQDIFFTETCRYADVVLPGAPALEKDGTFTNTERRIQRLYKALPELGDSRADWKITQDIANRMGANWRYEHPSEVMDELASLTPLYAGVNYERLEGYKTLQWPVAADGTDQPILYLNGFAFPDKKARLYPVTFNEPTERPDKDFDLFLNNGRLLEHFHEGNMTYRIQGIREETPERFLEISEELAKERSIESGHWVRVTSRHGSLVIKTLVTHRVHGKQVYLPLLSREGPINVLTGSHADPATNTPAYKETAVNIKVLPERGTNPLKRLNFRYSGKPTPQTGVEIERKWKRKDYRMPGAEQLVQIQTQK